MSRSDTALSNTTVRTPHEQLQDASDLAYLLYRRNKNQHRRSHWWKHFNTFRRQLAHLLAELPPLPQALKAAPSSTITTTQNATPTTPRIAQTAAADETVTLSSKAQLRVDAWTAHCLPTWFSAFSQVLAERRFVALGLAILGLLARVCRLTGATAALDERMDVEMEAEAEARVARLLEHRVGEISHSAHRSHVHGATPHDSVMQGEDDLGVAVARSQAVSATVAAKKSSPGKRKISTGKKRKRGDAIDDIFGGL